MATHKKLMQKMKILLLFISITISSISTADYSNHEDSKEVIDELVNVHGFEESFVIEVLKNAKKSKCLYR